MKERKLLPACISLQYKGEIKTSRERQAESTLADPHKDILKDALQPESVQVPGDGEVQK
jgi:hypothetical protein